MNQNARRTALRILAAGDWPASAVSQAWSPSTRRVVSEVEAAIEQAWTTALARPGVHLFDGPMCRMESWNATDTRLRLTLSKTNYKTFVGTNMAHPEFAERIGAAVMANPVGISPALLSGDGQLLLGHRTKSVAYYPERIHPFAGSLEPGDSDVFAAVARELNEELSLQTSDIAEIRCTGIAEDQILRQPELIFSVRSQRTRAEIEARLDPIEHRSIHAIPATAEAVEQSLREERRLTPVGVATLLLWGRLALGQQWFDKTRREHAS
jgi:8-oxo-dGTP pyrophosphatase MutT (NUDIX family)